MFLPLEGNWSGTHHFDLEVHELHASDRVHTPYSANGLCSVFLRFSQVFRWFSVYLCRFSSGKPTQIQRKPTNNLRKTQESAIQTILRVG